MRGIRTWGPVIATVVVVVAVATVVAWRPWDATSNATEQTAGTRGFTRHAGAVQTATSQANWLRPGSGLFGLVPYRDCVLGFGGVENARGTAPAFWTDTDGRCDRLRVAPDPAQSQGDFAGSHATDTTPTAGTIAANGHLVAVATERDENDEYSSSGQLFERDATGQRHLLA